MTPFSAVGLELWSMTSDIFFDNFIICTERAVADDWASDGWGLKKAADGAAEVRNKGLIVCSWLNSRSIAAVLSYSLYQYIPLCTKARGYAKPDWNLSS